jgi:hypothetical protein
MKITETRLRKIIREQIEEIGVTWAPDLDDHDCDEEASPINNNWVCGICGSVREPFYEDQDIM